MTITCTDQVALDLLDRYCTVGGRLLVYTVTGSDVDKLGIPTMGVTITPTPKIAEAVILGRYAAVEKATAVNAT